MGDFDWSGLEDEHKPALSPIDALFAETALRGIVGASAERMAAFTEDAAKANREAVIALLNQALNLSTEVRAREGQEFRALIEGVVGGLARQLAAQPPARYDVAAPHVEVRAESNPQNTVDTAPIAAVLERLIPLLAASVTLLERIDVSLVALAAPRALTIKRDVDGRIAGANIVR